jgi:hypothetical protein
MSNSIINSNSAIPLSLSALEEKKESVKNKIVKAQDFQKSTLNLILSIFLVGIPAIITAIHLYCLNVSLKKIDGRISCLNQGNSFVQQPPAPGLLGGNPPSQPTPPKAEPPKPAPPKPAPPKAAPPKAAPPKAEPMPPANGNVIQLTEEQFGKIIQLRKTLVAKNIRVGMEMAANSQEARKLSTIYAEYLFPIALIIKDQKINDRSKLINLLDGIQSCRNDLKDNPNSAIQEYNQLTDNFINALKEVGIIAP